MTFNRDHGGRIVLGNTALTVMDANRQCLDGHAEAGGILLGRLIQGSSDIVIDDATSPGPGDRRSRFFFFRAREHAQCAVDDAWRKSGQTQIYFGEWHTHPEDYPTPSVKDLRNWCAILRNAVFEQNTLFFVIVGRMQIRIWEGTRDGSFHERMHAIKVA